MARRVAGEAEAAAGRGRGAGAGSAHGGRGLLLLHFEKEPVQAGIQLNIRISVE